jgi:hypothetical protein
LKATLTNLSDHEITICQDTRGGYAVDVVDESGKFAPDKRPGYRNGRVDLELLSRIWTAEQLSKSGLITGSLVYIHVKPGRTLDETIEISRLYDMTQPGVYTIMLEHGDPESGAPVRSSPIKVTVTK